METSEARRAAARRALALSDDALRSECVEEFFIAQGPGGQHRNTSETGVRLTHPSTELSVTATERRSQFQNRGMAMERLREGLVALTYVAPVRKPTKPSRGSKRRRLESKKLNSVKKQQRKGDW